MQLKLRIKRALKFDKHGFVALLSENYPLLSILVGVVLVSVSIGPFYNVDTQLEFDAALGVLKWGMPFRQYVGDMINQPPLAFYITALFLKVFGSAYSTGVALITAIGLGCTCLVYKIGKIWYSKPTALLAAALFALTPWQLALSRSYLIDVPCLFFSLLFLLAGIYAIHKDSYTLFMLSGVLFAIAFLTKFFAVFTLIPLALFCVFYRQRKLRHVLVVAAYFLPVLVFTYLWYHIISGRGFISIFDVDDFSNLNAVVAAPAYSFLVNFLLTGLGGLFLIAAVLSLIVTFSRRKLFAEFLPLDLICVLTIVAVGSLDVFLAVGLNYAAPYFNPIKYTYLSLPFFSLLAASLVSKWRLLFNSVKAKEKLSKLVFSVAFVVLILLTVAMFLNMNYVNYYSTWDHWLFKVEMNQNIGYAFLNFNPIGALSSMRAVQCLGFAVVLSGLLWATRNKLGWLHELLEYELF